MPSSDAGSENVILDLVAVWACDKARTGGKGAHLARLIHAGFPVPEGFCLTTTLYRKLTDDPTISRLIDELESISAAESDALHDLAGRIRDEIRGKELPFDVLKAIERRIDAKASYSVRSSATAEDLPTASFAGQHDTLLDITGIEAITRAILQCMASLYTDRAVSYRVANNIPHRDVSMAVVVQQMIEADISGVLFTADPVSGRRTTASIDAAFGPGEGVVSGTVTAENIRLDRRTGEVLGIEVHTGNKITQDGGGLDVHILTEKQIQKLYAGGEAIERLFGSPQDIEWSFEGEYLWILQSRPITTLFPIPEPRPDGDGLHVYYSWNHRQGMTEAMPPLVVDYWIQTMDALFHRIGFSPATGSLGATAGGLVYFDVTPFLTSKRLFPYLREGLSEFDQQSVYLLDDIVFRRRDEMAEVSLLRGLSPGRSLIAGLRLGYTICLTLLSILHGLVTKTYEQVPARSRRWADQSVGEMILAIRSAETGEDRIRMALEKNKEFVWTAMKQALLLWNIFVYRALLRRVSNPSDDEFEALERGLSENVTTTMMLELGDITDRARDSSPVRDAIIHGGDLEEIRRVDDGDLFVSAFTTYLQRYGFRAPSEIEFSRPRYDEAPSMLLQSVRASLQREVRGGHRRQITELEARAEDVIADLEKAARRGFFGFLKPRLVRAFALRYRKYLSIREITKYALSQLIAETRHQVLAAGELLKREGGLREAEDVWMYTMDELQSALRDPKKPLDIDLNQRRADFHRHQTLRAPAVITSDGEVPRGAMPEGAGDGGLTGIATSGGVAEGVVRVILYPGDAALRQGEILVAPHTDPGWTPLFLNAAGLITNVGGVMTHGSLVAREYGIPSVVLAGATDTLRTGQRIRLDGNHGIIELLEND